MFIFATPTAVQGKPSSHEIRTRPPASTLPKHPRQRVVFHLQSVEWRKWSNIGCDSSVHAYHKILPRLTLALQCIWNSSGMPGPFAILFSSLTVGCTVVFDASYIRAYEISRTPPKRTHPPLQGVLAARENHHISIPDLVAVLRTLLSAILLLSFPNATRFRIVIFALLTSITPSRRAVSASRSLAI